MLPGELFSRIADSKRRNVMVKYVREDWTLFCRIETLCQKAGVTANRLQRLVLKELVDNALDAAGTCEVGELPTQVFSCRTKVRESRWKKSRNCFQYPGR
jgi:hypothetical protein